MFQSRLNSLRLSDSYDHLLLCLVAVSGTTTASILNVTLSLPVEAERMA